MNINGETKNINTTSHVRISETVLLAMAPALAYYLSFTYEKAYCSAFGLPTDLVKVELTTTLAFAAALIGIFISVIFIINSLYSITGTEEGRKGKPFLKLIWFYMPIIILTIMYLFIYDFGKQGLLIGGLVIVFVFLDILPILLDRHKAPTFKERLELEMCSQWVGQSVFSVIRDNYRKYGLYAVLLVVLTVNIAAAMGRAEAAKKHTYYVPYSDPDLLVARIYGDKAICISIDNTTGNIQDGFVVINIAHENKVIFRLSKINKIKIK